MNIPRHTILPILGLALSATNPVFGQQSYASLNVGSGNNNYGPQSGALLVGQNNETYVPSALAVGTGNIISYNAQNSILAGNTNSSNGNTVFLFGNQNGVSWGGNRILMSGELNYANSGSNTTVLGYSNEVYNSQNLVTGKDNYLGGDNNFVSGLENHVAAENSAVIGKSNNSRTVNGMTLGLGLYNVSMGSTIVGTWNATIPGEISNGWGLPSSPSETTWRPTDSVFVVGNGQSNSQRSNALVILKNGTAQFSGPVSSQGSPVVTQASMNSGAANAYFSSAGADYFDVGYFSTWSDANLYAPVTFWGGEVAVSVTDNSATVTRVVTTKPNGSTESLAEASATVHAERIHASQEAKLILSDSDSSVSITSNGVLSVFPPSGDLEMGNFQP